MMRRHETLNGIQEDNQRLSDFFFSLISLTAFQIESFYVNC